MATVITCHQAGLCPDHHGDTSQEISLILCQSAGSHDSIMWCHQCDHVMIRDTLKAISALYEVLKCSFLSDL